MSKIKLYIANINFKATEAELKELFAQVGEVTEAIIIKDRLTNRSRGFGFVTISDEAKAKEALAKFNGFEFQGRNLVVNEARPRT